MKKKSQLAITFCTVVLWKIKQGADAKRKAEIFESVKIEAAGRRKRGERNESATL
jgi:hypothetical protein